MTGLASEHGHLLREVDDFRRRLWLQRTADASWRGLGVGLIILFLVELLIRLAPAAEELSLLGPAVPIGAVLGPVALNAIRRPTQRHAARVADRRFGLRAQLATALELVQSDVSPFGAAQVARAVGVARQAREQSPEPVQRWAATILACVLVSAAVGGLTLRAEDWLRSIQLPAFGVSDGQSPPGGAQPDTASSAALSDDLALDDPSSSVQLGLAEQALAEKTDKSRATQQALSNLASALQQTSAGQAAADALNSGDYATAANEIAELGRRSDELSLDARSALSKSLEAAAHSPSALSDREQRASQALRYQSYAPAEQSLQNLADAVSKVSQSVIGQDQLSAAWQKLAAAQRRAQAQGGPPSGNSQTALAPGATGPAQVSAGGPRGQTDQTASGQGNSSSRIEPGARTDLSSIGVPVSVPLQGSGGPARRTQPSSDQSQTVEVVSEPATAADAGASGIGIQTQRAERNSVPPELRPVVREYFGNGTPGP